ncbi:MAG: hypothetical protein IBX72_06865 [Nitrospirae bacterium]|nr:hypothetical protein [Nitrospirota bacterium]
MNDLYKPFCFHVDTRLPRKLVDLYGEAKKDAGGRLPILVVKDKAGNRYEITSIKDKEIANRKLETEIQKRFGSSLYEYLLSLQK